MQEKFAEAREQLKLWEKKEAEMTDQDRINNAKASFRRELDGAATILFFVELTPRSTHGARCQLVTCTDRRIEEDSYRIAVTYRAPQYYHVRCFEEIADFDQAIYLNRLQPLTRFNVALRGLKGTSVLDGNYLVDGGAERLVLEWKVLSEKLIKTRDGVEIEPEESDFDDLLHKSGLASYTPKITPNMSSHEFFNLSMSLAPFESDGIEDEEEWNLFEQYLTENFEDIEDLKETHSLSDMLSLWKTDQILVCADEDQLTPTGKEEKEKLSKKATRAIKRLSGIPMPDFQSAFFGRLG